MSKRMARVVLVILFVYFVVMSVYAILRAWLILSSGFEPIDLVIFNESLATTIHGTGFFYNHIEGVSHFGVHNSPVLFFLLPFYKLWPSVYLLIVVQTLAVTLGAVPIFKLADLVLNDERKALAFMLLYLFNPFVLGVVRFDFHAVSLGIPFLTLSLYYLGRGDYRKAFLVSLFVLLVREDAGLFSISVALMLLADDLQERENRRYALLFLISGVLWIMLSVFVVIPHFSHFRFGSRYTGRILWRFVIFLTVVSLASTGFLPLFSGKRLILIVLPFLELSLSNYWAMLAVGDHYQWLLGPLLVVVAIYGARHLKREWMVWASILIAGIFSIIFSPVFCVLQYPPYLLGTKINLVFKLAWHTWLHKIV